LIRFFDLIGNGSASLNVFWAEFQKHWKGCSCLDGDLPGIDFEKVILICPDAAIALHRFPHFLRPVTCPFVSDVPIARV
jgi:hypothetical protein